MSSQPQRPGHPFTWRAPPGTIPGPRQASWVKITQIRTLAVERLGRRIGRVDEPNLTDLVDGLLQTIR